MSFTKLYLTTKTAPYTPATLRGAWDDTAGAVTRALETQKGDGGAIASVARAETNAGANFDVLLYRGVSGPIAARSFSASDTIQVVLGVVESNALADFAYHVHVYITQGDSDTPRGTLLTNYVETTANEWPTIAAGKSFSSARACASVSASAGDRIVVEIGYVALNASTTSRTGTLWYGTQNASDSSEAGDLSAGSTAVTAQAGFVQFNNSIDEVVLGTRVTQLPVEVITSPESEIRLTQLPVEAINAGSREIRLTQFAVEIVQANFVSTQRLTQLVVEVVTANPQAPARRPVNVFVVT